MRAAAKASAAAKGVPTFRHAGITVRITRGRAALKRRVKQEKTNRGFSPRGNAYSLLRKSVISGSVQSTAPMNFRRITPLRSII